jgi:hypothetical protein
MHASSQHDGHICASVFRGITIKRWGICAISNLNICHPGRSCAQRGGEPDPGAGDSIYQRRCARTRSAGARPRTTTPWYAPMEDDSLDIRRYLAAHLKDV